jgi:hypothetical protein
MFSEDQLPLGNANFFGGDDFVREGILEDAVLMDARFVGERVRSYDGFIGRYSDTGNLRQQLARVIRGMCGSTIKFKIQAFLFRGCKWPAGTLSLVDVLQ